MVDMRGWSFPIGRFLGVDVRIHTFFLLLLGLSISYASVAGASGARGFALWLLLLLAVAAPAWSQSIRLPALFRASSHAPAVKAFFGGAPGAVSVLVPPAPVRAGIRGVRSG